MLKIIESDSFNWDYPDVSVLDFSNTRELVKSAAHSEIKEYITGLNPEPNRVYLHILALGAGEATGSNRNGDYFPEGNLRQYFKTFEDGHIFTHHRNKNPETAIGKILLAVYNERMNRVEIIAWVDKNKGQEFVSRVENGEYPAMSMAVKTPYDTCSICGNQAKTRQAYCSHLRDELGRMYPDGRKVMAVNDGPLKFFEQSFVFKGADPTSQVLQKVAGVSEPVVSSAELAERIGLTEKTAAHKKLSELVKEIEGTVTNTGPTLQGILDKTSDPDRATISHLSKFKLEDVLETFAALGMTPSLEYLAELIGHKIVGGSAEGIGELLHNYISANGTKELVEADLNVPGEGVERQDITRVLSPFVKSASLYPDSVMARSSLIPATNVGYAGNGPRIEDTSIEHFNRLYGHPQAEQPGGLRHMLKTLIMIGGAALAAKWYITNAIEKKMKEQAMNQPRVQVVLVKSAQDYQTTYRLAKLSLMRCLT